MIAYYAASIGTGLTVLCLMWLALNPASLLRTAIFGVLAAGTALFGIVLADRLRAQATERAEMVWWEQEMRDRP